MIRLFAWSAFVFEHVAPDDAVRTLDSYSARVRDEVDLQVLEAGLIDVVDVAMRPAQVSLWIRDRAAVDQPASS